MLQPQIVAECCAAVREATSIPMTVKCRIGNFILKNCLHHVQSTSFSQWNILLKY